MFNPLKKLKTYLFVICSFVCCFLALKHGGGCQVLYKSQGKTKLVTSRKRKFTIFFSYPIIWTSRGVECKMSTAIFYLGWRR